MEVPLPESRLPPKRSETSGLLHFGQSHEGTARSGSRSRRGLSLLPALVLSVVAFVVFAAAEARAQEQHTVNDSVLGSSHDLRKIVGLGNDCRPSFEPAAVSITSFRDSSGFQGRNYCAIRLKLAPECSLPYEVCSANPPTGSAPMDSSPRFRSETVAVKDTNRAISPESSVPPVFSHGEATYQQSPVVIGGVVAEPAPETPPAETPPAETPAAEAPPAEAGVGSGPAPQPEPPVDTEPASPVTEPAPQPGPAPVQPEQPVPEAPADAGPAREPTRAASLEIKPVETKPVPTPEAYPVPPVDQTAKPISLSPVGSAPVPRPLSPVVSVSSPDPALSPSIVPLADPKPVPTGDAAPAPVPLVFEKSKTVSWSVEEAPVSEPPALLNKEGTYLPPSNPGNATSRTVEPLQGAANVLKAVLSRAMSSMLGTLQSAATETLGTVIGPPASPATETETPVRDAPPPPSPFSLPVGGSSFSMSGGGQIGSSGGGLATLLLLLCVLCYGLVLMRRDGALSWSFREPPKMSSFLRPALERPG